jgi:hypothetical protein
MASKKDPVGFLSRVATLFRDNADVRPTPDKATSQDPSDAEHARLQAVLQANKRRDDQVRKREFNHLRKLRKSGVGQRLVSSTSTARPSVFQASSSFGIQERAVTLQKINAIESTIVESWTKTKTHSPQGRAEPPNDFDLDFTAMPLPAPTAPMPEERTPSRLEHALQDAALLFAAGKSDDAASKLRALYIEDTITAEDAALLANTLFDLYRTIGAVAPFDTLALNYAQRFGRSPAEWFSLPELLHDSNAKAPAQNDFAWVCPPALDTRTIEALQARYGQGQGPSRLDWGALQNLPADAGSPLAALLADWTARRVSMQWSGEQALLRALEQHTPQGIRSSEPLWWHMRLTVLCLLRMPSAFEALALEYCVLFEESPPCWQETWGLVVQEPAQDDYASIISSLLPLDTAPQAWQDLRCTLHGDALGATSAALKTLHGVTASASQITVDCALLGRLDVEAASAVVQWARAYAVRGCEIEFTQLTHLLAILLQSVGLDSYAQLSVRRQ